MCELWHQFNTRQGGNAQCGWPGACIEEKYLLGWQKKEPYDPGCLVVPVGQLSVQIHKEFLFLEIWDFFFCYWLSS